MLFLGSLQHILGVAIRFIASAASPKNSKTPKIVKEQLLALLTPLLLNKSAEFLGEMVGGAIDSVYVRTDAPLNAKLVELIAADALKAVCYSNLRAVLKPTAHNAFIEETLSFLHGLLLEKDKDKVNKHPNFDQLYAKYFLN